MAELLQSLPFAPGYSIRVASRLTGLSADTLRMWERRYGFPKPERNDSQIRVYSEADVERLILVGRALKAGYRAGEVIRRPIDELKQLLAGSAGPRHEDSAKSPTVEAIVSRVTQDDVPGIRAELRQAIAALGPKRFLVEVAGPLLEQVGELWAGGHIEVHQEHLLSEILSTQLRLLLSAHEGASGTPLVLLSTLANEQHGLGLEMAALYLVLEGAEAHLLGLNTPPQQIAQAARALGASVVGLSISPAAERNDTEAQLARVLRELPSNCQLWLGGKAAAKLSFEDHRLRRVVGWAELEQALSSARAG